MPLEKIACGCLRTLQHIFAYLTHILSMKQQSFVIRADWEDMVFEGREQAYGAFALRRQYPWELGRALLIVALATVGWILVVQNYDRWFDRDIPVKAGPTIIDISAIPPLNKPADPLKVPPPPPPPAPPKLKTLAALIPLPTEEELSDPEATIETIDSLKAAPNLGLVTQDGLDEVGDPFPIGDDVMGEVPEVIVDKEPSPMDFQIGDPPVPVNLEDIKRAIGYPPMAVDVGLEGTAVARVLVDQRGRYMRHIWINQPNAIFADAISPQLSKLYFTPATQAGRPIKFWVNIPFVFSLVRN